MVCSEVLADESHNTGTHQKGNESYLFTISKCKISYNLYEELTIILSTVIPRSTFTTKYFPQNHTLTNGVDREILKLFHQGRA